MMIGRVGVVGSWLRGVGVEAEVRIAGVRLPRAVRKVRRLVGIGAGLRSERSWAYPGLRTAVHVDGTINDDRDRGWRSVRTD